MNWHERFKKFKKDLKLNNTDIANITGLSSDSIRNQTQPSKDFPRWLKLAIVVFESKSSDGLHIKDVLVLYNHYKDLCFEEVNGDLVLVNDNYLLEYNTYKNLLDKLRIENNPQGKENLLTSAIELLDATIKIHPDLNMTDKNQENLYLAFHKVKNEIDNLESK